MRNDAILLEEARLQDVDSFQSYQDFHERHRVFPEIFENRHHKKILDVAAGVGCAAQRVLESYPADILCNDITPKCLKILDQLGLATISFNLDDDQPYPFVDGQFDAIISLSTIEHLIHVDHFLKEIHRILSNDGFFYLSAPNYASISFLPRLVVFGKSFHDPLAESLRERYEFYAHVRYFTFITLQKFVSSFGFDLDTVYLPLPAGSTRYKALYNRSKTKAIAFRYMTWLIYKLFSPRWASEPILCFHKADDKRSNTRKLRKVLL